MIELKFKKNKEVRAWIKAVYGSSVLRNVKVSLIKNINVFQVKHKKSIGNFGNKMFFNEEDYRNLSNDEKRFISEISNIILKKIDV